MILRATLFATLVLLISIPSVSRAAEWYVDVSVTDSGDGTTPETAFKTIGEGMAAASAGDEVIVAEGVYVENVNVDGKDVVLRSTDPTDRSIVGNTIIDGNKAGSVVTFAGVEDESCVLSGFTIRNGQAAFGGGICGGTETQHTHATIEHNVIADNEGNNAAGLVYCDGLIQKNVIRGNSAPGPDYGDGGAFGWCDGLIQNNLVVGNSAARNAGGFYMCNGTIRNNTIVGNKAYYGGLEACGGAIYNCIIWESGLFGSFPNVTYCCIQGGWGGEGNTSVNPRFVDADGPDDNPDTYEDNDYRVWVGSSCVDAGKNEGWMEDAVDLDGNPRIRLGRDSATVDMGAYERAYTGVTSQSWHVDGSVSASGDGTSPETAFKTIQEGINAASDAGDTIILASGTYMERIDFNGKNVVLRSTDPTDQSIVENTIIDGNEAGSVVTFAGMEDETCVLSGFTIRNGQAPLGGGICGGTETQHTHATIEHNVIADNEGNNAAGLVYCDGLIQKNVIRGNSAPGPDYGDGGAFGWCDGLIQNNLVVGNSAGRNAGGFYMCNGTIRNNTIVGNKAYYGGLEACGGAIYNCIIWESGLFGSFPNVTYCCVQGGWTGEGNIGGDPLFVDADGPDGDPNTYEDNDYRLQSDSPCIDKGKTEEWTWEAFDIAGNPRILPGPVAWKVDMGAYEYVPPTLRPIAITGDDTGHVRVIRISQSGEACVLQSCLDLLSGNWQDEGIMPSEGSLTTWIEPDTAPRWKFYRIEIR